MQRITVLKDIGVGKKCLIIGGGMSVQDFDFDKLDPDIVTIGVNESGIECPIDTDYMVYNDVSFIKILKVLILENKIPQKTHIIGFANSNYKNSADYYYRNEDVNPCKDQDNTGMKAIVIARNIMNFDVCYLIGFDFQTRKVGDKEQSHFYGDPIGKEKKYPAVQLLKSHFQRLKIMIDQFENISNLTNIYNCYEGSSLKLFPYLKIY